MKLKFFGMLAGAALAASALSFAQADNTMSAGMSNEHMMSQDHMMAGGRHVTLTGNVVDLSCYIGSHLHGPKHAACARACILNGQEMGILLPSGQIVAIFGKGPGDTPNKALLPYVERKVIVTGEEFIGNGITGIRIDTIRRA